MDQPFFLNTSKDLKLLGVKSLCIEIEKDSLAQILMLLTVHWTHTDWLIPLLSPIAPDKCKLSLNSVNCKYVNSKLRAAREQCADWCWWIPSQIQTEVLRHFRPGDFRQETFYDNVTVQIFSDKSIEVIQYIECIYQGILHYSKQMIILQTPGLTHDNCNVYSQVTPGDSRADRPGLARSSWPASGSRGALLPALTLIPARRGGIKQTDTWDEAVMELPH